MCTVGAMITQVWNPCAPLLLCTVGSYHPGVEPLCPFTTVHCGHRSPRCGTPVPLYYCVLYAVIPQVWNPCAPLLLCTVGSDQPSVETLCLFSNVHCGGNDHPSVEPLCPFTTVQCRQWSPRCGTPVPLHYCTLWGNDHLGGTTIKIAGASIELIFLTNFALKPAT